MVFTRRSVKRMRILTNSEDEDRHVLHHDDFISRLPNDILLMILDKLPMEDAVATSLLSWRWMNLWKFMSCVDFNHQWEQKTGKSLGSSVNQYIKKYEGQKIKRFSLSFRYASRLTQKSIISWINFAVKNNVEELYLDFNEAIDDKTERMKMKQDPTSFELLQYFSKCSTLLKLKLKFIEIDLPPSNFHLSSLKELLLDWIVVSEDAIENISVNCPALQLLSLSNCNKNHNLNVTVSPNSNLSRLIIKEDFVRRKTLETYILISAPKVEVIEFLSSLPRINYYLVNVPAGVKVNFSTVNDMFYNQTWPRIKRYRLLLEFHHENLQGLLKKFQAAKVLHLSRFCIQYLSMRASTETLKKPKIMFNHLTDLVLDTRLQTWELPGIIYLLRACTNLKNLTIVIAKQPTSEYLTWGAEKVRNIHCSSFGGCLPTLQVVDFKIAIEDHETWKDGSFDLETFFTIYENARELLNFLERASTASINLETVVSSQDLTTDFQDLDSK